MAMNIGAYQSGGMDIGAYQTAGAAVVALTNFTGLGADDLMKARLLLQLSVSVGQVADLGMAELESLTASTGHFDDLLYEWLGGLGYSQKGLNGRLIAYLNASGYTGTLPDMLRQAMIDGYYF